LPPGATINYEEADSVIGTLKEMTGGMGPDFCIDAVGMEAHGSFLAEAYDPHQAGHDAGNRPAHGASRRDPGLPQRWNGFHSRRLWRIH
jgi:threonine dehydrogenase-like Zn-dependent dehydrogenase